MDFFDIYSAYLLLIYYLICEFDFPSYMLFESKGISFKLWNSTGDSNALNYFNRANCYLETSSIYSDIFLWFVNGKFLYFTWFKIQVLLVIWLIW